MNHETSKNDVGQVPPAADAAAVTALPLLLALPDVSWPPPRHADRLPRVALEDVTAQPTEAEASVMPASRAQKVLVATDRIRVASTSDLPWHERPVVREWIAKLASGGIIALVVLTLAGMFTRPWRAPSKTTAVSAPIETDLELKVPVSEPIIRQAQRDTSLKIETKLTEKPVQLDTTVRIEPTKNTETSPPKLPLLTAPPTIAPDMPVRLPAIDEPELNGPEIGAPTSEPSSSVNSSPGGISGSRSRPRDVEHTAQLRGIIEPSTSRLR